MQRSTKWLLGINIAGALLTALVITLSEFKVNFESLLPEKAYLFAHIFGAVIFLGNIIITGAWMILAERSGQDEVIKFAARGVNWADVFFTAPGVYLILVNGIILAQSHGGLGKSWIAAALILFSLSGVVWYFYLMPVQDKIVRLVSSDTKLTPNFYNVLHRWYFWGLVATILPLVVLVLMVVRPNLW